MDDQFKPPAPETVEICTVCQEPWPAHLALAVKHVWDPETDEMNRVARDVLPHDCVTLLLSKNTGPAGHTGATGVQGPQGVTGTPAERPVAIGRPGI